MKKFFGLLLMFLVSFVLSANAVPKGSPPTEKQLVTVQTVATVDQVVNPVTIDVTVVNYCVEKQSINYISTSTKSGAHYAIVYTDSDYGNTYAQNLVGVKMVGYNINPTPVSFMNAITT